MMSFALDHDELEEMVSYRKNVTGIANTIFISPKGNARHPPRIKIAIDPPHSLDPRATTTSIDFNGQIVAGARNIDRELLNQVRRFIKRNRIVLLDYWNYQIDTDELRNRLKMI